MHNLILIVALFNLASVSKQVATWSTAFYMQPKQRATEFGQSWYKSIPVGVNPLKNTTKISELGGLRIKYTNHSLRATSASCMFISGVPEKLVAKVTGHKKVKALRQYEQTTESNTKLLGIPSIICVHLRLRALLRPFKSQRRPKCLLIKRKRLLLWLESYKNLCQLFLVR